MSTQAQLVPSSQFDGHLLKSSSTASTAASQTYGHMVSKQNCMRHLWNSLMNLWQVRHGVWLRVSEWNWELVLSSPHHTCYSQRSMSFSEGVLMWEVYTLGKLPYERLNNMDIVEQVSRGLRLYRPQLANEKVYSIMACCWGEVRLIRIIQNANVLKNQILYFDLTDFFFRFSESRWETHLWGAGIKGSGIAVRDAIDVCMTNNISKIANCLPEALINVIMYEMSLKIIGQCDLALLFWEV